MTTKRRPPQSPRVTVPTLLDSDGHRHIIPAKDKPAYCGAVGTEQDRPREWRTADLCLRCVQQHAKLILGDRLKGFGI